MARAEDAGATAPRTSSTVNEVVVTALKRSENIQKVPVSMNVVQKAQIEAFDRSTFNSLQGSIPSLFIETSPSNDGIYLRGFGSSPANPAIEQSISLYQDGVYAGRIRQFMAPFFDVDRIEVLRGPQGALLGKNTAAGAISIVTSGPTDTFQAGGTVDYNISREGVEAWGYVSGPIAPALTARLALRGTDLGGYFHNTATGNDDPSEASGLARLSLKYEPSDRFDVTTKLEFGARRIGGSTIENQSQLLPELEPSDTRNAANPLGRNEFDRQTTYNSITTANYRLGDYTLTSITGIGGFRSSSLGGGAALNPENLYVDWDENFDQQSEELRLTSPTGRRVEFIAGLYGDHSEDNITQALGYNLFGGFIAGHNHSNFSQGAFTASAFVQATWHVTDDTRLLGSLRYTYISKHGIFNEFQDVGTPLPGAIIGDHHDVSIGEHHYDPSITLQHDFTPRIMGYVTYARGSKSGGFDPSNSASTDANFHFRAEQSENYEVGEKSTLFDGRVTLDLSAFWLNFTNLQVGAYVPPNGLETTNAASATSKGVEATASWRVTDDFSLSGSGAYVYAAYNNFPGAPCLGSQSTAQCDPTAPTAAPNSQAHNNIRGQLLPFTPRWSGEITANYHHPIGNGLAVGASVTAKYRSAVWVDTSYDPGWGQQRENTKLDARIQIGRTDGRWTFAVVGTNLTNVLTVGQAYKWPLEFEPNGDPVAGMIVDEGRVVSLQVSTKF